MNRYSIVLSFAFCAASACGAGELDVAREALRDGLFEVARAHAAKAEGDLAKVVILESFARENNWSNVLATAEACAAGGAAQDFLYYKAVALYRLDRHDEARKVLEATDFTGTLAGDAALLNAAVLRREGYVDAALSRLSAAGAGAEAKMAAAEIRNAKGEEAEAAKLWKETLAMTNAPEKALAVAAANLADTNALRRLVATSHDPGTVRFAALRLGGELIRTPATFAEGAELIRKIVKDSPDVAGVREAFLALAGVELARGEFESAAASYRRALETWPETAKESSVRLGLGWALAETGRRDEALAEFAVVPQLEAGDETRSLALVKSGDVLVALGRGEEAIGRYREAIAKYPATAAAKRVVPKVELHELGRKGRDAFAAYRFDEARKVFAEIARRDPSLAERMRYFDMLCLYGLGRDAEAGRRAAALAASSSDAAVKAEAALWLAKFLFNSGDYRAAESNFCLSAASASAKPETAAEPLLWAVRAAFAAGDFQRTVQNATALDAKCPGTRAAAEGMLLQAEALIELARFDEAALVAERAAIADAADAAFRLRAQLLRADALFAMGADNPVRYREALEAYSAIRSGEGLSASARLRLAYKIARTLERLKRTDEAVDEYYTRVVLAFRDGRAAGTYYDEEAVAAFTRAAFRLAEEYESRGLDGRSVNILTLVVTAGVPASDEASKRIERIHRKGKIL